MIYSANQLRAEVELRFVDSDKKLKVSTDTSGRYFFGESVTGKFEITVRAPGFRIERADGSVFEGDPKPRNFGLIVGSLNDLPGVVINGSVEMNGKPVNNATVGVINVFNTDVKYTTSTGSNGRYRFEIVDPGQYLIYAFANDTKVDATSLYVPSSLPRKQITRDFVLTGF